MNNAASLVWFRNDLRITDNPALRAAAEAGGPVCCLYVLDEGGDRRPLGGASRWWLHHALAALDQALRGIGARLIVMRGDPAALVPQAAEAISASAVFWNRRYGGAERELDSELKLRLRDEGRRVESFNAALLREPWEVKTGAGGNFKVFTPFWRAACAMGPFAPPLPAPLRLETAPAAATLDVGLEALGLLPTKPDWAGGLRASWTPGEAGAAAALAAFLDDGLAGYAEKRDLPGVRGTSRLSPHLAFGDIGPRAILQAVEFHLADGAARGVSAKDRSRFEAEVGWREFAHHVLYFRPDLATANVNPAFDAMAWDDAPNLLEAWRRGRTGYPIVDAGMRELWREGWMHNRVRMITASLLIKHLGVDWRLGEQWFWDTLVDADGASNPFGWQWVAGSGHDASPYYRIFNPIIQGAKFDAGGDYIRRNIPELARLPDAFIHTPWEAPMPVLRQAGVVLGQHYPRPVVDHAAGRERALASYRAMGAATGAELKSER